MRLIGLSAIALILIMVSCSKEELIYDDRIDNALVTSSGGTFYLYDSKFRSLEFPANAVDSSFYLNFYLIDWDDDYYDGTINDFVFTPLNVNLVESPVLTFNTGVNNLDSVGIVEIAINGIDSVEYYIEDDANHTVINNYSIVDGEDSYGYSVKLIKLPIPDFNKAYRIYYSVE